MNHALNSAYFIHYQHNVGGLQRICTKKKLIIFPNPTDLLPYLQFIFKYTNMRILYFDCLFVIFTHMYSVRRYEIVFYRSTNNYCSHVSVNFLFFIIIIPCRYNIL
jgi:hypothetical protein